MQVEDVERKDEMNAFRNGMNAIGYSLRRNQPKIFMAAAGGLGLGGTLLAMWRAEEAAELKKERRKVIEERDVRDHPVLERLEVEVAALPAYVPSLGMQVGSLACLGLSGNTWSKRLKAAGASYEMLKSGYDMYREKVTERIGEKKASEIEDAVVQTKMQESVPKTSRGILISGYGDTLMYDVTSGRWFYDDVDRIHRIENLFNQMVNLDGYATLNDLYELMGLDPLPIGDNLGCDIRNLLEIKLVAKKLEMPGEREVPGLAISYDVNPLFD